MLDLGTAIGVAASAAQLADLAFAIVTNLHKYYRNVKYASARCAELWKELDSLADVLTNVQEMFEHNLEMISHSTVPRELENVRKLLNDLHKQTKPEEMVGTKKYAWPFKEKDIEDTFELIEHYKANLNTDLNVSQRCLSCERWWG
jgi:RNAse (barnase) inhibitor barstar